MAAALIKITQGALTDSAGRALVGTLAGGAPVFSNGDNTGVTRWVYTLLETPPGSAISTTVQDSTVTQTFALPSAPDKPGSYRVQLDVYDVNGVRDTDIRNFAVPFPNIGFIAPPYQGLPPPLPTSGTGSKPDEMNFAGQGDGWGGDTNAGRRLLYQALENIDQAGHGVFPLLTTTNGVVQTAGSLKGTTLGDGLYQVQMHALAYGTAADHASYALIATFLVAGGVVTQVATTQDLAPAMETAGAAAWDARIQNSAAEITFDVLGAAATTVRWTVHYRLRRNYP